MTAYDYGVESIDDAGKLSVSAGWVSAEVARAFVASHSGRSWHPRPVRAVRREVGEWVEVEES